MIRHCALFKWSDSATDEQKRAVPEQLAAMPGLIAEIRRYAFGPDAGLGGDNWDFAVVADFDDAAGYRAYAGHPDHVALIEARIRPIVASVRDPIA